MYKIKHFIDLEKEEAWLRDMSVQGWDLSHRGLFGFRFNEIGCGEQIYRIDYRTFKTQSDFVDYICLFQDAGWEHVSGKRSSGYQYFVARNDCPNTDIFSNHAEKTSRYRRLAIFWLEMLAVYLTLAIVLIPTGAFTFDLFLDQKALYYTPGLWETQGLRFWTAFLFETPFVVMRNFMWLFMPAMISFSAYYAIRALMFSRRKFGAL